MFKNELNKLFISEFQDDIVEFYNRIGDRDSLIDWMVNRPDGKAIIKEKFLDSNITVVIPTISVQSKFSIQAADLFNGVDTVFVESGHNDPYFNYGRNCNKGVHAALKHDTDWIILANDDIYKIDEIDILVNILNRIDNNVIDIVYAMPPLPYHSRPSFIGKKRKHTDTFIGSVGQFYKVRNALENRFRISYKFINNGLYSIIFYGGRFRIRSLSTFSIFSTSFLNSLETGLFDETYINAYEDIDLSYRVSIKKSKSKEVKFKVGDYIGSSLGNGHQRDLRSLASAAYFNYKMENKLL